VSPQLRLLYVGPMSYGGTCLQRFNVLSELGCDVTPLDVTGITKYCSRLLNSLQFRTCWSPRIGVLNRQFTKMVGQVRPDVVWVDKGIYLWPESLRQAREKSRLVHYNPDDPFGFARRGWRLFLKSIPEYDLHFVARDVNIEEFKKAGARKVVRHHWAFDRSLHHPREVTPETRQRFGGPIGFIGDWEVQREKPLRFLADHGHQVRIWGTNWERRLEHPHRLEHPQLKIEGQPLWGENYAQALCSFDINLNFLRRVNRDLSTTRSIEIPACGAFMLAERTDEHLALFEEGKEAEFFSSDDEMLDKTRYYLSHPDIRRRIGVEGLARCHRSGYSNHDRLGWMLQKMMEL